MDQLSTMFERNGVIDEEMLGALLSSATIPKANPAFSSAHGMSPRRSEIASMLLRAIPALAESVPLNELLQLLIRLASSFSMLGMERKQAFVLRQLLHRITPALIEARKVGAAEMGIHPAASLLALSHTSRFGSLRIEEGMRDLLTYVGLLYGALEDEEETKHACNAEGTNNAGFGTSGRTQLQTHAFGNFDLKVDVLKSCIAICEVLPDFEGVLKFSVHLLHLSRQAITLLLHQPSGTPAISQEEQARLMDSIKRTVGAATKLGLTNVKADYWDDYLVRGIEAVDPPSTFKITPHSRDDLQSVNESEDANGQGPFIYNPFSKLTSSTTEKPLVANEIAYFSVYLQNPYEINVEIDEIYLLADGCDFQPSKHSIVLGHFCCQKFTMAGRPIRSGTLKIIGCRAKIRYCKERDFYIFPTHWQPRPSRKAQGIGSVGGSIKRLSLCTGMTNMPGAAGMSDAGPRSDTVQLTVMNAQPVISLHSTTLSQPAVMVLEGEKKTFDIFLRNESNQIPVDLLIFSFQDSATTQLRTALLSKDLSPTELYELQLQLAGGSPFKHVPSVQKEVPIIPAGEIAMFTIEVLGIPGLLNGTIQVDYAHIGVDLPGVKDKFYTRQLSFPVAVTVNASIDVPRCNILPFSGDFAWWNRQRAGVSSRQRAESSVVLAPGLRPQSPSYTPSRPDAGQFTSLLARLGLEAHSDDHCLLLLDLRNVWPLPLSMSVHVREGPNASSSPTDRWRRAYTVHESLQPGHVARAILLIPRAYVPNPYAPIPLLGSQRQFVVSASKLSAEAEQANREAFWYREELLKHVRGSWREDGTGRQGTIDLRRGIRLNARMIEVLKVQDIGITLSIQPSTPTSAQSSPVVQDGSSRFRLQINCFTTLTVKVHNRSSSKMHVLLRIQPSLRDQPHNIALDLFKRFAWTGMLQRALHPPLAPGEIRETSLGIMALCAGQYEIAASVEELKALGEDLLGESIDVSSRSNDRRIWHAREPCLIDAVDCIN